MSLLKRLFQIISNSVPAPALSESEAELLTRLNPDKFYVENVRSILNTSYSNALRILETGVRQGVFLKGIEVRCPDGAVAVTAEKETDLPKQVRCWIQHDGHLEPEMLPTENLEKAFYYRLNEEPDSSPVQRTA